MGTTLVSPPAQEPLDVDTVKLHVRQENTDDDALIRGLIVAARQYVESYTRRQLITQTWDYTLDAFPCGALVVPLAPVSAVTFIQYLDTAGVTQTWSTTQYLTDIPSGPWAQRPRIAPAYGVSYPSTYDVLNAVTVRVVAGYGASGDAVPGPIKSAMLLLIGQWYAHREPQVTGNLVSPLPHAVDALLWPYKVF